jgi:hypothetical protein
MGNSSNSIINLLDFINGCGENTQSFLNIKQVSNKKNETLLDILNKNNFLVDFNPKNRVVKNTAHHKVLHGSPETFSR